LDRTLANAFSVDHTEVALKLQLRPLQECEKNFRWLLRRGRNKTEQNNTAGSLHTCPVHQHPEVAIKCQQDPVLSNSHIEDFAVRSTRSCFCNGRYVVASLSEDKHTSTWNVLICETTQLTHPVSVDKGLLRGEPLRHRQIQPGVLPVLG